MRRVSIRLGAALVLFAIVLITPAAWAGDQPPGTEPPDVRIAPPIGVASIGNQPPGTEPPDVRIGPPGGVNSAGESPSIFELFWFWMQARIGPPTG